MNSPNTILLTSEGEVQTIPNFDYQHSNKHVKPSGVSSKCDNPI